MALYICHIWRIYGNAHLPYMAHIWQYMSPIYGTYMALYICHIWRIYGNAHLPYMAHIWQYVSHIWHIYGKRLWAIDVAIYVPYMAIQVSHIWHIYGRHTKNKIVTCSDKGVTNLKLGNFWSLVPKKSAISQLSFDTNHNIVLAICAELQPFKVGYPQGGHFEKNGFKVSRSEMIQNSLATDT